jgi:hypothetical protein
MIAEGIAEGSQEGIAEGSQEGIADGSQRGRKEALDRMHWMCINHGCLVDRRRGRFHGEDEDCR